MVFEYAPENEMLSEINKGGLEKGVLNLIQH